MRIVTTSVVELTEKEAKKKIIGLFRDSFSDPTASENRAEFVAKSIGISVNTLYAQIEDLGLKDKIKAMRKTAKDKGLVIRKDKGGVHAKKSKE